jgi:predicted transposase/invertase (TIGR01784 family)
MASTIQSPHDAIFKGLLGKPEHARGVLREVVPVAVAKAIDWQTLTQIPGNFIDLELRQQYTDLLFSARWHEGSELLAYFLFEHLSAPPKTRDGPIAYRLLRYQVRIWEDWFSRNPEAKTLPMIIPIVMYHGQAPWSEPRLFGDVLAVPPGVRPAVERYLVQFAYLLDDLSEISDDELRARAMTAVAKLVALCFKHARTSPDFMTLLRRWMDVVREVVQAPNGLAALAQVLCYVLQVSEHVEREALKALLAREIGPETEEAIVTAGQLLIEQGREEGRQQGREEGREEGRQRLQEMLLQLLRQRFGGQVDSHVEQRIGAASIEQVETWTRRVLSVATLGELFAN